MSFVDEVKSFAKLLQKVDNLELYREFVNLQTKAMELAGDNANLKKDNAELKERLEFREKLYFQDNMFWHVDDTEKKQPYCSKCYQANGKPIFLHDEGEAYRCPECDKYIRKDGKPDWSADNIRNFYA
jgi:regulator of replication initiation timing